MTKKEHRYTLHETNVSISPSTNHGYWIEDDGSEGGELWFDRKELVDFDGAYFVPANIAKQIRALGYKVKKEFLV